MSRFKELKKISDELYKLNVNNKELTSQEQDRSKTLNIEQGKLQEKVKIYTDIIETLINKEKGYIEYIDTLKKIPEKNAEEEFKNRITSVAQQPIETITLTALPSEGGGHLNYGKDYDINYKKDKYRKTHKNKYKTNTHAEKKTKNMKYRIIRKKTLRKLKKYMRKHKYTR